MANTIGKKWLVTGVSGYIGNALLEPLSQRHEVVGITRKRTGSDMTIVQGDFASFEDLRQLDGYEIGGLVHLGAATGGQSEEDCLEVNVLGTRRLLRYLIDRGCRKFVLASSIAAVGCLDAGFLPEQLPMADDHPGRARDAYGFSKALMEELTGYLNRLHPDTDFINLRLGAVLPKENQPPLYAANAHLDGPMVELARVRLPDVLNAILAAVESPYQAGVRTYNVVDRKSYCETSVLDILRAFYGERLKGLDLSSYERPGHEMDSLYAVEKIQNELGLRFDAA
jgi:UDP-glucose 4-epimerase